MKPDLCSAPSALPHADYGPNPAHAAIHTHNSCHKQPRCSCEASTTHARILAEVEIVPLQRHHGIADG